MSMSSKPIYTLQLLFQHTRNLDSPIKLYSKDKFNNHVENQLDDFFLQISQINEVSPINHRVVAYRLNSKDMVKRLSNASISDEFLEKNIGNMNNNLFGENNEVIENCNGKEPTQFNNLQEKFSKQNLMDMQPSSEKNTYSPLDINGTKNPFISTIETKKSNSYLTSRSSNHIISGLNSARISRENLFSCSNISKDADEEVSGCEDLKQRYIKYSKGCVLIIEMDVVSIYDLNFKINIKSHDVSDNSSNYNNLEANVIFSGSQLHHFSSNFNNYLMNPIFDFQMNPIGHLNCYFVIIKPYNNIEEFNSCLKSYNLPPPGSSTLLVGHRGFGSSFCENPSDYMENSYDAFLAANKFGLDFVEFDVQLTKDKNVVIYHDFETSPITITKSVSLNNIDNSPINNSNNKLLVNSKNNKSITNRNTRNDNPSLYINDTDSYLDVESYDENDYMSSQGSLSISIKDLNINQLRTIKFQKSKKIDSYIEKKKDLKGNMFLTLREALNGLPVTLGFNIEIKSAQQKMDGMFESNYTDNDKNFLVDSILDDIMNSMYKDRKIYFSSFDPWVCTILKKKQSIYPVFFLFELRSSNFAGYVDARSHSIENALSFVLTQNIDGLVINVENILDNINIISSYVHSKGVHLFTYGNKNNELKNVVKQINNHIDGIIFDDVASLVPKILPLINNQKL